MSKLTRTVTQHHRTFRDLPEAIGKLDMSEAELLAGARQLLIGRLVSEGQLEFAGRAEVGDTVLGIARCPDTGEILNLYLTSPRRAGDESRTEMLECNDTHWITDVLHDAPSPEAP